MLRRQPVPASQWFRPRVIDHEQLTRGLVLEPFPQVPFGGASAFGQLRRGGRTAFCECPIQPESFAKVDGVKLQRSHGVAEQPLTQRLRPVNVGARISSSTPRVYRLASSLGHHPHLLSVGTRTP